MIAARRAQAQTRLLRIDPAAGTFATGELDGLTAALRPGDLVVVNDAATLPASLRTHDAAGRPVELRLYAEHPGAPTPLPGGGVLLGESHFSAVAFGAGDWRTPTEHRPPPPPLHAGDVLTLDDRPGTPSGVPFLPTGTPVDGARCSAHIEAVRGRRVEVRFSLDGDALWAALYRAGRAVQYAHLDGDAPLWAVQTRYATRPWAAEQPSAGRSLTWELLLELRRRGVGVAALTHACGLSATGDDRLDAALPLPERYDIPAATVRAIAAAERVIAVGTSVVRALEGCVATRGHLVAGSGETALVIDADFRPRVVDGLFTGMHEPGTSHRHLLEAFVSAGLLDRAHAAAEAAGFLGHELGDACLILAA